MFLTSHGQLFSVELKYSTSSSFLYDVFSNIHRHFHPIDEDFKQVIHYWRLIHRSYSNSTIYKNGDNSTVAYWAETLIFGGPVLFQRGEDKEQVCIKAQYFYFKSVRRHIYTLAKETSPIHGCCQGSSRG